MSSSSSSSSSILLIIGSISSLMMSTSSSDLLDDLIVALVAEVEVGRGARPRFYGMLQLVHFYSAAQTIVLLLLLLVWRSMLLLPRSGMLLGSLMLFELRRLLPDVCGRAYLLLLLLVASLITNFHLRTRRHVVGCQLNLLREPSKSIVDTAGEGCAFTSYMLVVLVVCLRWWWNDRAASAASLVERDQVWDKIAGVSQELIELLRLMVISSLFIAIRVIVLTSANWSRLNCSCNLWLLLLFKKILDVRQISTTVLLRRRLLLLLLRLLLWG